MKITPTRMKPVLSILVCMSAALATSAPWAHEDCTPYTAVLHLEGPSPFGPLNGDGIYNIGDLPPQQGLVSTVLAGSASFDPTAPVIELKFADMVLFPPGADGSLNILTAIDRAIGAATGPGTFEGQTRSRITGGTGVYEGVTGRALSTNVTSVDLTTGHTVSDITVNGEICGIGEGAVD